MFHYGNCREEWRIKQLELNAPLRSSPYKRKAFLTEQAFQEITNLGRSGISAHPQPNVMMLQHVACPKFWKQQRKTPQTSHLVITTLKQCRLILWCGLPYFSSPIKQGDMPWQETNDGILIADFHVKHLEAVGGTHCFYLQVSMVFMQAYVFLLFHGLLEPTVSWRFFFGNDAACPLNEAC